MALKPKVGLGQDFLSNLSKIPPAVQSKILKWAVRFQADPTASGINYESIKGARDKNLKSVRIDQDWRGIVFKPASGDLYVLMYVDHHDDAYRWAEGRKVAVNPTTGALQLFAVEPIIEPAIKQVREDRAGQQAASTKPQFANLSDAELMSLGVPQELLNVVRSIRSEAELDATQQHLPVEAYEGLFLVMAGDTVSQVLASRETRVDRPIDTTDFLAAIETPEAKSRFVVVADEETMAAMLNSPLSQWRVFLHPTQRKLAQSDRSGPMRVLGGAGTGKTVLAMHRTKWLAEQRSGSDTMVLFTTFTKNLAADIEENLKTLCSPGVMQKIEVKNLDAWVHGFLRRHKYEHTIIYDRNKGEAAAAWRQALALQDTSIALPQNFYEEELERVVLAQGVTSKDGYRQAKRTGRGVVLTRNKRDAIWPVFEEYRAQLASHKLKEVDDAYRDAAALMREAPKPYSSIVIDETQDFGPQALQLLRAMVPEGANDLFFVGDGHQRIYPRHRASMHASGIDIRGRSRKLYLNYRTTEEIRKFAVATLQDCEVDDLDEGADEVKRYKSLSHGPLPETLKVQHREDALQRGALVIRRALDDGRYVCVIVPRNSDAADVEAALKKSDLLTTILGPDQRDQADSKAVRIATMHRAKGLEFDEVVLLLPADLSSLGPLVANIQQLQYVALTRAKKTATVIRYGGAPDETQHLVSTSAITSTVNDRRIRRAQAWLRGRAPAEEVLIVGATLDAANELVRAVGLEKGAAFGWHRLTLSQLAAAIAAPILVTRRLIPLSRVGTEAIIARLVHSLNETGRLGRYRTVAPTPGFSRAVAGVITELRLARLPSDAIAGVVPDFVPLIWAYEAELKQAGLTDWAGVLALATEAASLAGTDRHHFFGRPMLLLDVPIGSEAELVFIRALAASARELLFTVPAADRPTLARLRSRLRMQVQNLDEATFGDRGAGSSTHGSTLENLQRRLFAEEDKPIEGKIDNAVEVFSAPGEGRECIEIARRVLSLARQGVRFDRIAVLMRSPEEYRAYLEEAFNRADIPVHFTRGAVRPDPAGRAFCALLKCAAEGLSAQRFAEYLSLGQVPDAAPGGTPPDPAASGDRWVAPDSELASQFSTENTSEDPGPVSPADYNEEAVVRHGQLRAPRRWERLLVEAAVIGGRDRWRRRIDGLANDLRVRLSELGEEDEIQATALSRTLEDLAAFAGYAIPLIDVLDALPASATWGEWLDQLAALATQALKQPDRVLAVLAELAPMSPIGPLELKEVLLVLERLLLEVAVPPSSQRYGKVLAAPIDAARGLSFEAVFVPGVAERMFPRKIVEEPILLDVVRAQIGEGLATNQTRLEGERLAMALAAGSAERRICFSYPRLDLDQARPRVPSFYTLEAVRAAEGVLPDFGELAHRAETATTARLGWPAPSDPADAVDESEHDLAILNRLEAEHQESPGAARYLVTVNPYLARALRTRYQRWGRSWTASDGLLSQSKTVRAIMAKHTLALRSYSPTALQNYGRCPYRFFLQAIHGLAPREIPDAIDELDPLQRGSLIHDVQFDLFARLRQDRLLPVRPSNLEQAQRLLDAVVAEVAARYKDDLAPAIDRVWEDGVTAIRADLREWLRRASEDDSGYVPWHFELSFGLKHHPKRQTDPTSVPAAVDLDCGIQLRGSIDLVERHPSGMARVTDHKTGKANIKPTQLIDGGKSLQPLLYALAAEKLFAGQAKISSGRLYFCTSAGGFTEQVVVVDDNARAAVVQLAGTVGDAVSYPFLPAAPDTRQCDLCEFRVVCGPYEERRAARKPQRDLEPLLTLREMP